MKRIVILAALFLSGCFVAFPSAPTASECEEVREHLRDVSADGTWHCNEVGPDDPDAEACETWRECKKTHLEIGGKIL